MACWSAGVLNLPESDPASFKTVKAGVRFQVSALPRPQMSSLIEKET